MAAAGFRSRAIRLAEAGFATIALLLCAKVFATLALTTRAQRRSNELFVSVSTRVDYIAEMNEILASLHADVQQFMTRANGDEIARLATVAHEAEVRFFAIAERYDASSAARDVRPVDAENWYRTRAVARVYFSTLQRLLALAQRGDPDGARVLLHDALEPTRVREAVLAARVVRRHAAYMHTLHGAIQSSFRGTFQVDLGASLVVLALLLVVRRMVMERLLTEESQRAQNLTLLAQRNRDLDEFAHRIAHDLKGIVNPITGYASLIAEAPGDSDRVERYAERIAHKTDEVVAMVDEILRLARAGNVSRGPTQPLGVISSVVEQYEAEVADSDARIEVQCDDCTLDMGSVPLREVVQNLVQNALKYRVMERALVVRIVLWGADEIASLEVCDNGRGMSAGVAAQAHEPFFRAATERDVPGSGLGLAIVHRIATAHGGGFRIESTEGTGTTVRVTLPRWHPSG